MTTTMLMMKRCTCDMRHDECADDDDEDAIVLSLGGKLTGKMRPRQVIVSTFTQSGPCGPCVV